MNIIGIIPARLASTRFPNKPLAEILGIPMIGHVYHRSKLCSVLSEVYVATCDKEIVEYIESIGGKAIMTANTHERASDRTAEAMLKIEKQTGKRIDIVVMIQGDEAMVTPQMIENVTKPLIENKEIYIANLTTELKSENEENDPNEVKVVVDKEYNAMYFSREPIPSRKKGGGSFSMLKQVAIIPFQRDFLLKYNNMEQTPLEKIESVDMLRIIENGMKVKMIYTDNQTYGVDTKEDLAHVEKCMESDNLFLQYRNK